MSDNKTFPLQPATLRKRGPDGIERVGSFEVPWELAELAYREYARKYGTQQSMERLKERHGFGIHEFASLLNDFFEEDTKYDAFGRKS